MNMSYQIEKIQKPDHPEVVEVWEASVRATHHFLPESDIEYFKPLILDQYLDAVDLRGIKDENNNILAFLGVAEENIEMLFVHPKAFGKGIGRSLMNFAINELNATKVDVNEDNPQAVGFYKHIGFKVVRRSPLDGLGKPYPILHMELG